MSLKMDSEYISAWLKGAMHTKKKLESDVKDARRWRYTQREGYFSLYYPCRGDYTYQVGIQLADASVNQAITGRGRTLEEAIDNALAKEY